MRNIKVLDDLHPEDVAMLQALYSRSPASVDSHLEKVKKSGSGNFMGQFYVGYGHASIGDCGSTTIFVENISMLAAKSIQDWPLYSGQESSTRYIDFSKQEILDPCDRKDIQDQWMNFYHRAGEPLLEHLKGKYPIKEGEDAKVYERAIKARSFDILRGFLPAGATTNVAWHTNLRQASDKIAWMKVHPVAEVREIATEIYNALKEKYPNSFREDREAISEWKQEILKETAYNDIECILSTDDLIMDFDFLAPPCQEEMSLLEKRPKGATLPHVFNKYGNIISTFLLDFGSFRDVQRHRNGVIEMPLLTTFYGIHPWYLEQLPNELFDEALDLIDKQTEAIEAISDKYEAQYYCAMGFCVFVSITQGLPAFVYRVDLRTSKTVHPTLRSVCQREAVEFKKVFPQITLHVDMEQDDWDVRRGTQTITEK